MSRHDEPTPPPSPERFSASRPGRVRVHWPTYLRCHPAALVGFAIGAALCVAGFLAHIAVGTIAVVVFVAALLSWANDVRLHLRAGDVNPGLVVSTDPGAVAILADMTLVNSEPRYAVVVAQAPLAKGLEGQHVSPGDRVTTVCRYGDPNESGRRWGKLFPIVTGCATNSEVTRKRLLDSIRAMEWDRLDAALAQVPRPFREGIFPINEAELLLEHDYSESGAPIWRHEQSVRDFEPAFGNEETIEEITGHLEEHFGEVSSVLHEIVSDLVHVDLHVFEPTEERDFYVVATTGMSDRPMTTPDGLDRYQHAEIIVCLPSEWPMEQDDWDDETAYWPLRWLKMLARFPHEYDTWIFEGHTVPTNDPPEPFADDTDLCCCLLAEPVVGDEGFAELTTSDGRTIHFLQFIPLYAEEMEFKLASGYDALLDLFNDHALSPVVDPHRPNLVTEV